MYVERQVYKNAKTHNVHHRCLCFIFDQAWTWFQSPVMKKQLSMTWETWRTVTKLLYILVQGARYKKSRLLKESFFSIETP